MIKIVDSIDIVYKGAQPQGTSIYNRNWQPLHLRQGDMDGACAVYSLMMYLIALKILTYNQVTNLDTSFKGQTSKGRLFKEFFIKDGLCRSGFYFSTIEEKLKKSFAKIVIPKAVQYESGRDHQQVVIRTIKESLEEDAPIMIAVVFKGGAHAILAVGYEERNGAISKFFCLDPGCEISNYSYWNTVIRINDNPSCKYSHVFISDGKNMDVYIDETLKITKK